MNRFNNSTEENLEKALLALEEGLSVSEILQKFPSVKNDLDFLLQIKSAINNHQNSIKPSEDSLRRILELIPGSEKAYTSYGILEVYRNFSKSFRLTLAASGTLAALVLIVGNYWFYNSINQAAKGNYLALNNSLKQNVALPPVKGTIASTVQSALKGASSENATLTIETNATYQSNSNIRLAQDIYNTYNENSF